MLDFQIIKLMEYRNQTSLYKLIIHYIELDNNKQNPILYIMVNILVGPDIYEGLRKHYTVVNSGPKDHINANFINHGAPGLMFDKALLTNINIYVTTSDNPNEFSYPKNYNNLRHTYLGDYYSGAFLEVIEKQDLTKETIAQSYKYTLMPTKHPTLALMMLLAAEMSQLLLFKNLLSQQTILIRNNYMWLNCSDY
ncbi:unnamed protein product [Medioppia subpectinata]|uniref:Uncharacterized protein n=1 Tax=Medioppia subpectinata TaxID=1979941 RepID=A0A7R9KFW3_9ACAR|nr:unnamed protein product [Medioppia subpectinata]CAG2102803.1 unnamed protein product [Medioppia subpectinata]